MPTDDELLAAYLDGVAELAPDERHRVERRLADDPALRTEADGLRALLERARALPRVGGGAEPDWAQLERRVREAVGPTVPVPWWRRARWLAPVSALVTTAALALLWLHHVPAEHAAVPSAHDGGTAAVAVIAPSAVAPAPAPPASTTTTTTMWIDGQVIDVGNVDPESILIDDSDSDSNGDGDPTAAQDDGLLPATDYGWIDGLNDKAIERAERWLARTKKGKG